MKFIFMIVAVGAMLTMGVMGLRRAFPRFGDWWHEQGTSIVDRNGPYRIRQWSIDGKPLGEWVSDRTPYHDSDGSDWFFDEYGRFVVIKGEYTAETILQEKK